MTQKIITIPVTATTTHSMHKGEINRQIKYSYIGTTHTHALKKRNIYSGENRKFGKLHGVFIVPLFIE